MKEVHLNNGRTIHIYDSADEMTAERFVEFSKMLLFDSIAGAGNIATNILNAKHLLLTKNYEEAEKTLADAYSACRRALSTFNAKHAALAYAVHELKLIKDPTRS